MSRRKIIFIGSLVLCLEKKNQIHFDSCLKWKCVCRKTCRVVLGRLSWRQDEWKRSVFSEAEYIYLHCLLVSVGVSFALSKTSRNFFRRSFLWPCSATWASKVQKAFSIKKKRNTLRGGVKTLTVDTEVEIVFLNSWSQPSGV